MYPVDEHDRVVPLDGIPKPETGAPEPVVIADEQAVVLYYVTEYPETENLSPKFCAIRFHLAHIHLFGARTMKLLRVTRYGTMALVSSVCCVWINRP